MSFVGTVAALVLGQHSRSPVGEQCSSVFSQGFVVVTAVGQWQKLAHVIWSRVLESSKK